jgi:hypothetical protein
MVARVAIGHLGNLVDPKVEGHEWICKHDAYLGLAPAVQRYAEPRWFWR